MEILHTLINIALGFSVAVGALALCLGAIRLLDRLLFPGLPFEAALRGNNIALAIFLAALVLGIFGLVGRSVAAPTDNPAGRSVAAPTDNPAGRSVAAPTDNPAGRSVVALPERLSRYDDDFRKWGRYHFGYALDWRWFKAQGLAESGLNPRLCSHAGACGLMQFMPATARAMGLTNRFDARESIRQGIRYDRMLWEVWKAPRPLLERLYFTLVSYNAGLGNALRFQARARAAGVPDANRYAQVEPHLWPEPRAYVAMIRRWRARLGGPGRG